MSNFNFLPSVEGIKTRFFSIAEEVIETISEELNNQFGTVGENLSSQSSQFQKEFPIYPWALLPSLIQAATFSDAPSSIDFPIDKIGEQWEYAGNPFLRLLRRLPEYIISHLFLSAENAVSEVPASSSIASQLYYVHPSAISPSSTPIPLELPEPIYDVKNPKKDWEEKVVEFFNPIFSKIENGKVYGPQDLQLEVEALTKNVGEFDSFISPYEQYYGEDPKHKERGYLRRTIILATLEDKTGRKIGVEFVVIPWGGGEKSPKHDHTHDGKPVFALEVPIRGTLEELRWNKNNKKEEPERLKLDLRTAYLIDPETVHQVFNTSPNRTAVTFILYVWELESFETQGATNRSPISVSENERT